MTTQRTTMDNGGRKNGARGLDAVFTRFARATSRLAGRPVAFGAAVLLVVGWALAGPALDYSEQWQIFVNTVTTIVTFLMVFLMQSTQNRDTEALQLKIDELIRAVSNAEDRMIALDEATEEELAAERERFRKIAQRQDVNSK